jgi:hypothetical protein
MDESLGASGSFECLGATDGLNWEAANVLDHFDLIQQEEPDNVVDGNHVLSKELEQSASKDILASTTSLRRG